MLLNREKQQRLFLPKKSEVEVCSEDDGFKGAWYRAVLEDAPTISGRKKVRVCYHSLLDDDGETRLIEFVDQNCIRPVPPNELCIGFNFEEGSVVDADHRDGWWTGVVIKVMEDEKFMVYFDFPPDVIQFEKKHLRPHFYWDEGVWRQLEKKPISKSIFSPGTMVEVNVDVNELDVVWVPAMVIKELEYEKQLIVRFCKSLSCPSDDTEQNRTVDWCNVRPTQPPLTVVEYELLELVDVLLDSGWRQGLVRQLLSEKRYLVHFEATKEQLEFHHSDLRPSMEWEDGVWHKGSKRKPGRRTPSSPLSKKTVALETILNESYAVCRPTSLSEMHCSNGAKPMALTTLSAAEGKAITPRKDTKRTRRSNGEISTETEEPVLAQESENKIVDAVMASIAEKSGPAGILGIHESPMKKAEAKTQAKTSPKKTLQPMKKHKDLGNDLTGENGDNSHKRKRGQEHNSELNQTGENCNGLKSDNVCKDNQTLSTLITPEQSSVQSSITKKNSPTDVEKTPAKDTTISLPFVKRSPIWKTVESMEVFKAVPQNPHFSPLLETREEFREGSAIGVMVMYSGLLDRVKDLQFDVPTSALDSLKECFSVVETHGFDVTASQSQIDKLLAIKDMQSKTFEELKCVEKEITEKDSKRRKFEEELGHIESKIRELQNEEMAVKEQKEAVEKEIDQRELYASSLDQKLQVVELEFQTTVSGPCISP